MTGQKYCRATVLESDVALCISSCSPHPFFCHRQRVTVSQITAALHYCNTVSRVRELCRGADRNKKTAHRAIFLCVYVTEIKLFYFRFLSVQSYFFRHFGSVFLLNIDYLISIFIILLKFFFSERKFF